MSVHFDEHPRADQFELRYLYGKPKHERLRDWLRRMVSRLELALSVIYLCGFASLLVLTVVVENDGRSRETAPESIANQDGWRAYEAPLKAAANGGAAEWKALTYPSTCCALPGKEWTPVVERTGR
ncbi:MAG: hypothetical protein WBX25_37390 [Rhodomicrobium sp.]